MKHLNYQKIIEAKKRLKISNELAAVHTEEPVLDVKNLSEENLGEKKTQINYLCNLTNNSRNISQNKNYFKKFLNDGSATVKINLEQPDKCKETNLVNENNESLPEQSNTWWLYENYFLVFFVSNVILICKDLINPISLLPYVLSILLSFYFYLKSLEIYKNFIFIVNILAHVITSVCCLYFMFRFEFILKACDYDTVKFPFFTTLLLSIVFLWISYLPRKRFKYPKSYLVIPIFALYSFLVFIYFDFITTIPLVLGLFGMIVINLETDIYSNKYKEDLNSNFMIFFVGLVNVSLGLCHCFFSVYFLHNKVNLS